MSTSVRAAAIECTIRLRLLHDDLAVEFDGLVPPGQVWAVVLRSARGLHEDGCPFEHVPVAAEHDARALLLAVVDRRSGPVARPRAPVA